MNNNTLYYIVGLTLLVVLILYLEKNSKEGFWGRYYSPYYYGGYGGYAGYYGGFYPYYGFYPFSYWW